MQFERISCKIGIIWQFLNAVFRLVIRGHIIMWWLPDNTDFTFPHWSHLHSMCISCILGQTMVKQRRITENYPHYVCYAALRYSSQLETMRLHVHDYTKHCNFMTDNGEWQTMEYYRQWWITYNRNNKQWGDWICRQWGILEYKQW